MPSVPSRYGKNRQWALKLAAEHGDDTEESRLVALVVLWQCAREHEGPGFRDYARERILEALGREAVVH